MPLVSWDVVAGILLQALFWGAIDAGIGLIALRGKKDIPVEKVKKTFLVNAVLDVGYIAAGIGLILAGIAGVLDFPDGITTGYIIENGIGIIIQGAFLFVADVVHHQHLATMMIREPHIDGHS